MQDAWRAYMELAMGLTEASKKRATKVAKQLIGRGGATAEQLQALAEDLVRTSTANRGAITKLVRYELDRALGVVGLATAEEVSDLTTRVRDLEQQLREAEARAASAVPALADVELAEAVAAAAATPAKKTVAKKTVAKKTAAAKKTPAKKAVAKRAGTGGEAAEMPGRAAPAKKTARKSTAKKTARKSTAKKSTATAGGRRPAAAGSSPS